MNKINKKLVSSIGEFGLIEFIKKNNTKPAKYHNVILDIGDDCFAFVSDANSKYIVTTDILIENIHFKTQWATPEKIAQKAIEVNVSDLASMGNVQPLYMFVSAGIPKNTEARYIKRFFKSLKNVCDKYGIHISGGDTVGAEHLTISITLIAKINGKLNTRTGAKNSDLICATGTFGDSGAGLNILARDKKELKPFEKNLVKKHLLPKARLETAKILSQRINVTSMTDSSDGLFKSIQLLTTDNKKGAVINLDKIPVSKELKKFTNNNIDKIYNYALFGAEEFELVFTIKPEDKENLQKIFPGISHIGYVNESNKVSFLENGNEYKIKNCEYKHF